MFLHLPIYWLPVKGLSTVCGIQWTPPGELEALWIFSKCLLQWWRVTSGPGKLAVGVRSFITSLDFCKETGFHSLGYIILIKHQPRPCVLPISLVRKHPPGAAVCIRLTWRSADWNEIWLSGTVTAKEKASHLAAGVTIKCLYSEVGIRSASHLENRKSLREETRRGGLWAGFPEYLQSIFPIPHSTHKTTFSRR